MQFEIYGGFEITRKPNKHGIFDKSFWNQVEEPEPGLSKACGCYVFVLRNGNNLVTWYVGKTEKKSFKDECFQPTKINYYNEALVDHKGTPLLFLVARLTSVKSQFSKPSSGKYRDVDHLETMLIGMALEKNSKLFNVKKTRLLRDMVVPGIINSPPGKPKQPVTDLKNALGIQN